MVEGLAVEEVPLGVNAEAGVTVNGTEVLIFCLVVIGVGWWESEGDDQHPLPVLRVGDMVAEGGMIESRWMRKSLGRLALSVLFQKGGRRRF